MGLKKILTVIFLAVGSSTAMAQFENTENYRQRLGHGRDSVAAEKFYVDYVKSFRAAWETNNIEDWQKCYRPWKELMVLAPYSTYNLTNTGGGARVITELMEHAEDSVMRYVYFKDLMAIDNFRIQNREALNSIPRDGGERRIPLTAGSVLMWKAHHYHTDGMKNIPERVYSKDSAYLYFVRAFDQIKKENVGTDNEIEPNYLAEYFETCRDLFQTDEDKYMEQFLTDYTSCLETCDKMMAVYGKNANGQWVDSLRWSYYAGARNNMQYYFAQTNAGDKDNIIKYYKARIADNRKNYNYLKNAVHLMTVNGCIGSDVYFDACEASYLLQPDFENSIGMGLMSKTDGDKQTAMENFGEAFDKAKTDGERYLATRFKAEAIATTPVPSANNYLDWDNLSTAERNDLTRQWQGEQLAAGECFDQALQYAAAANIPGQDLAEIYYKMADAYRKGQNFTLARQSLNNVLRVYPAYPMEKLSALEGSIERGQQAQETRLENERKRLANDRARQEWERRQAEIARKQQAEADFWKKK